MIFIRAEIMRDSAETSFQTNAKYTQMRELQQRRENDSVQLMPGRKRPILPALEERDLAREAGQDNGSE